MKLRVGVLRGGPHKEYESSLATSKHIFAALRAKDQYTAHDIFIDRDGTWHIGGLPRTPDRVLSQVDVVINALHGGYGEQGHPQKILESHRIPFTGQTSLGAGLGLNKVLIHKKLRPHGLLWPEHVVVKREQFVENPTSVVKKIVTRYPHVSVVRSVSPDVRHISPIHIAEESGHSQSDLREALENYFAHTRLDTALVEELVRGRQAVCGVVDGERGAYTLHPIEITSFGEPMTPSSGFTDQEVDTMKNVAALTHRAIDLRDYSSSHFVINKTGVYLGDVHISPSLAEDSVFVRGLAASDIFFGDFVDHIILRATQR